MRLQGQGCSKFMASEFAGARPSAIRQKRHVDPGEPSCSPCSAAARPVYSDALAAADTDTLPPNSLRRRRRMQYCRHRGHVCQPSRGPGRILRAFPRSFRRAAEYARSSRRTAFDSLDRATPRPRTRREAARDPAWRSSRPGSNLTLRATCFCSTGSRATGKRSPLRRPTRRPLSSQPGGGDNAGKDDPAVPRTLLRLAFGRLVAIAEK